MGVACATTVFSLLNTVYFRPLPLANSDRMGAIGEEHPDHNVPRFTRVSLSALETIRSNTSSFERISAYRQDVASLQVGNDARQVEVLGIDSAFAAFFALRPKLGRLIATEEIAADAPVAVISDALWNVLFHGDSSIVGRSILLAGHPYLIAGVLPAGFRFPARSDVFVPLSEKPPSERSNPMFGVIAKLRVGVSRQQASAELAFLAGTLERKDVKRFRSVRLTLRREVLDRQAELFLPSPTLFVGAALLVLIAACSNIANLFRVRAADRRKELAIRISLGGTSLGISRLLLAEAVIIGAVASVSSLALASWFITAVLSFLPTYAFPGWMHFGLDWRVLLFSMVAAFTAAILAALAPLKTTVIRDLVSLLKGRTDGHRRQVRLNAPLSVQICVAVVLVAQSMAFLQTYRSIATVDLGYDASAIATVPILGSVTGADSGDASLALGERLVSRASGLPFATAVAVRGDYAGIRSSQRNDASSQSSDYRVFGGKDTLNTAAVKPPPRINVVDDGYFRLFALSIVEGRPFIAADGPGDIPVAIVSRTFATSVWPDAAPLGRTVRVGAKGPEFYVVGVVSDINDLRSTTTGIKSSPRADIYFTLRQAVGVHAVVLGRAKTDVHAFRRELVRILRDLEPSITIATGETLASQFDEMMFVTRALASLFTWFAVATAFLAIIGVYGLAAYEVSQRLREFAVRAAIGSTRGNIQALVILRTLRDVSIGFVMGLMLTLGVSRLLRALLADSGTVDAVVLVGSLLFWLTVSVAAAVFPARRAGSVDTALLSHE